MLPDLYICFVFAVFISYWANHSAILRSVGCYLHQRTQSFCNTKITTLHRLIWVPLSLETSSQDLSWVLSGHCWGDTVDEFDTISSRKRNSATFMEIRHLCIFLSPLVWDWIAYCSNLAGVSRRQRPAVTHHFLVKLSTFISNNNAFEIRLNIFQIKKRFLHVELHTH